MAQDRPGRICQPAHADRCLLLRFVAFYCMFDAMVIIFSSAIKGAGDTRFVLITTLCMSPLPVLATLAGVEFFDLGLYWSWTAITAWLCTLGVIYLIRFQQGHCAHNARHREDACRG